MYQLVLKNGEIIATHEMHTDIVNAYPGCEIITYPSCPDAGELGYGPDPRTDKEKKEAYKDRRRLEYPSIADQLDMIYHDAMDGTTTWKDAITVIKVKHPKSAEDEQ